MKHILLIATGGTIASGNSENGLTPQISSEELLSYVPAAREFCTIDAVQILNIDSTNLQPEHWLLMARTGPRLPQRGGQADCRRKDRRDDHAGHV